MNFQKKDSKKYSPQSTFIDEHEYYPREKDADSNVSLLIHSIPTNTNIGNIYWAYKKNIFSNQSIGLNLMF